MTLTKPGPDGDELDIEFSYQWDEVGQMVRAKREHIFGVPFSDVDFHYTYDATGIRVTKSVEDPQTFRRTYSCQIFDSLRLDNARFRFGDYERNKDTETVYLIANGTALARVIYDEELPQGPIGGAQHVFFTMADPLGSTSTVIDKNTGELVERTTYLACGQTESDYRPERWKAFREHFKFTAKEDDVGVGLTYFGARYYVPALAQWASADPLTIHGLGSDVNPYAYVLGSPQRLIDPTGLKPEARCDGNLGCPGYDGGWTNYFASAEGTHLGLTATGGGAYIKSRGLMPIYHSQPEIKLTPPAAYKRTEEWYQLTISSNEDDCDTATAQGCTGTTMRPMLASVLLEPIDAEEAFELYRAAKARSRALEAANSAARNNDRIESSFIQPDDLLILAGATRVVGRLVLAGAKGIAKAMVRDAGVLVADEVGAAGAAKAFRVANTKMGHASE